MKVVGRMKVVGNRQRLAGHVQRMSEERLTKRAWLTEEGGRRRRRRPTLRWRDGVKRDLERAEMNSREWERMAEDRNRWRRHAPDQNQDQGKDEAMFTKLTPK